MLCEVHKTTKNNSYNSIIPLQNCHIKFMQKLKIKSPWFSKSAYIFLN